MKKYNIKYNIQQQSNPNSPSSSHLYNNHKNNSEEVKVDEETAKMVENLKLRLKIEIELGSSGCSSCTPVSRN